MKLIAGSLNQQTLSLLNSQLTPRAREMKVAVAYAGNDCMELFQFAQSSNVKLDFYGRYDDSIAVSPGVIAWFLDRSYLGNLKCRLISDFYHPKVIWWCGLGAYIGSANLTNRAWVKNIEVGTFLSQEDLAASGMDVQLQSIFDEIHDRSHAIGREYLRHLDALVKARKALQDEIDKLAGQFKSMRFFPPGDAFVNSGRPSSKQLRKEAFQRQRLRLMEAIEELKPSVLASSARPHWLSPAAAEGVQIDQFLFAYHAYNVRGFNNKEHVERVHAQNKLRRQDAIKEAVKWWSAADYPYVDIATMANVTAPRLQELFARGKLPTLNLDEFCEAMSGVHAVQQFVMNKANADMGLPPKQEMTTKLRRHGELLWTKRSSAGKSTLQTLSYVIWGSDQESIETRLWNGSEDNKWALPWTRIATLGDILGWARPDDYAPVNGRSVKALRALGFDVVDESGLEEQLPAPETNEAAAQIEAGS